MSKKQKIIDCIYAISGKYSPYEVFADWVECMALAFSNSTHLFHDKVWEKREKMYKNIMDRYSNDEQMRFYEMCAWLTEALEDGPDDVLGKVYIESGMGSKITGQFFTPFHISEMTATVALRDAVEHPDEDIIINEPSCGGGGMIIAAAKVLNDNGIDYQRRMQVVAQDLDWKGVYMCYVQLCLLGIKAVCIQGDSLEKPVVLKDIERNRMLITPAKKGMLI